MKQKSKARYTLSKGKKNLLILSNQYEQNDDGLGQIDQRQRGSNTQQITPTDKVEIDRSRTRLVTSIGGTKKRINTEREEGAGSFDVYYNS